MMPKDSALKRIQRVYPSLPLLWCLLIKNLHHRNSKKWLMTHLLTALPVLYLVATLSIGKPSLSVLHVSFFPLPPDRSFITHPQIRKRVRMKAAYFS